MRDTLPDDPWHALLRGAAGARGADRARARSARRRGAASTARSARTSWCSTRRQRDYRAARRRGRARGRRDPRDRDRRPRSSRSCARRRIRRRSSCGRSSATSSTTARFTSRRSPTTRATSTSRSAGASAGSRGRSRPGRRRAGATSRSGSPKTSRPARRWPSVPLPAWVDGARARAARGVHTPEGAYSAAARRVRAALDAAGLRRQLFPDPVLGERCPTRARRSSRPTRVRMWHLGDDIGIVSFKTKMHTIGDDVLDGVHARDRRGRAQLHGPRDLADAASRSRSAPTSRRIAPAVAGRAAGATSRRWSRSFQQTIACACKYSLVPTVAAVRGMALGGGVRVHHALRPRGGGAGELHRAGRSRRGPAAGAAAAARNSRCARPTK